MGGHDLQRKAGQSALRRKNSRRRTTIHSGGSTQTGDAAVKEVKAHAASTTMATGTGLRPIRSLTAVPPGSPAPAHQAAGNEQRRHLAGRVVIDALQIFGLTARWRTTMREAECGRRDQDGGDAAGILPHHILQQQHGIREFAAGFEQFFLRRETLGLRQIGGADRPPGTAAARRSHTSRASHRAAYSPRRRPARPRPRPNSPSR